ncbi:hypothetical protein ANN_02710 [Periplaneta americana]|uniref:Uncharacterized protein n=1 Tax=Periplaneta americana TaxID=6978 RepID=A0ABQ8U0K1_PERAM|nr:hypothetical protein ANN_02710 [Periplaneta americana]
MVGLCECDNEPPGSLKASTSESPSFTTIKNNRRDVLYGPWALMSSDSGRLSETISIMVMASACPFYGIRTSVILTSPEKCYIYNDVQYELILFLATRH